MSPNTKATETIPSIQDISLTELLRYDAGSERPTMLLPGMTENTHQNSPPLSRDALLEIINEALAICEEEVGDESSTGRNNNMSRNPRALQ